MFQAWEDFKTIIELCEHLVKSFTVFSRNIKFKKRFIFFFIWKSVKLNVEILDDDVKKLKCLY